MCRPRENPGGDERDRLDVLVVEQGLAPTRTKARALILAGRVRSGERRLDKPGMRLLRSTTLSVEAGPRYVSRSGAKLAAALTDLGIDPRGLDALDVGSSTGGFTQVLLEAGARRVIALDVGRGQLDWSLRRDPRVRVIEGFNARHLEPAALAWPPSFAAIDVSFISLQLILPPVAGCLAEPGEIVALVKPQFEVGRRHVGRGGIVRDPALHRSVLGDLARFCAGRGWGVPGVCAAAVRGAEGNQEYFLHVTPMRPGPADLQVSEAIEAAVAAAEPTS